MSRFAAGLILLVSVCVSAPAQQYPFLEVPGSPGGAAALFQDSKGRLWLDGRDSAVFDGVRFFYLRDYGLPDGSVNNFNEDPSGAVWIAASNGLYRFADGHAEKVMSAYVGSAIPASADEVVAEGGPVELGMPVSASLYRVKRKGNKWISEVVMPLGSPGPITLDQFGMLLYPVYDKGWAALKLDDVLRSTLAKPPVAILHTREQFPGNGRMKVMRDHSGCVWVGATGGNDFECPGEHKFLQNLEARMHQAADGTMVLSGNSVLEVGMPGSFRTVTRANGLPGINDAYPAKDGTIWLASNVGLYRFASPFRLGYWTVREGVSDVPWSLTRGGGKMYAGLQRGLVRLSDDAMKWEAAGEKGRYIAALLSAGNGTVLAGFKDGGAALLAANGEMMASANPPNEVGMRLGGTTSGEWWMGGTMLGQLSLRGTTLKWIGHPLEELHTQNVLDIKYEEHTQRLWACYGGGLVERNEKGAWREFGVKDGLLAGGCWSIAPLPNGEVWYSYFAHKAMALVKPQPDGSIKVRNYQRSDELTEPGGVSAAVDNRGWIWRGGGLGSYVASAEEAEKGQWLMLDKSDGFSANGMNSGSLFVDSDGSLWWGDDNDITHYIPPADLVAPKFSPQVFVSAFSWNGSPARLAEAVHDLPYKSAPVVHIGSLQFERRNGLRVRYRILPEQTAWKESASLDVPLGLIADGTHTLEIQGRVFTGPWSGTVSRSFTVLTPTWRTWPWLMVYAVGGCLLAGGTYWLRQRQEAEESAAMLPSLGAWRLGALLPEINELTGSLLDDRFEVGDLVARGGFANVMNGVDRKQQQRCAVKIFRREVKDQEWIERRFAQEVAALQKVRHPNVVTIYAHGITPSGAPYLVMEFVEGKGLREVLQAGAIAPRRLVRMLDQLASALDSIHSQDICHRDVKPENIIIRNEGTASEESVLIDFSIAIVKDANETMYGLSRAAGSFDYMPPEQVIGYADPSSDIYSLAKLIIEMLTGKRLSELLPTASLDLPEKVAELLRNLRIQLSEDTIAMLSSALEFDPKKRPHAACEFVRTLIRDLRSAG